ncbi:uncharacterized protein BDV17DRAFT_46873 [Aspergillus undulatus]|uniref:uncharacterized protein n=1 Tax=Aspergillus undulatus TaxID=1810928 RepID=UPI003CCD408C
MPRGILGVLCQSNIKARLLYIYFPSTSLTCPSHGSGSRPTLTFREQASSNYGINQAEQGTAELCTHTWWDAPLLKEIRLECTQSQNPFCIRAELLNGRHTKMPSWKALDHATDTHRSCPDTLVVQSKPVQSSNLGRNLIFELTSVFHAVFVNLDTAWS